MYIEASNGHDMESQTVSHLLESLGLKLRMCGSQPHRLTKDSERQSQTLVRACT